MDGSGEFREVIAALAAQQVRFVIIGGVAMRLQGCTHVTEDIDLCYARDSQNLVTLANALSPYHARLRGVPEDLPFVFDARTLRSGLNFTLRTDLGDIDILGEASGVDSFEGLWTRATKMEVYGITVRVASVDDLLAMKRAANRPKDQRHIMELEALRRLLRADEDA